MKEFGEIQGFMGFGEKSRCKIKCSQKGYLFYEGKFNMVMRNFLRHKNSMDLNQYFIFIANCVYIGGYTCMQCLESRREHQTSGKQTQAFGKGSMHY